MSNETLAQRAARIAGGGNGTDAPVLEKLDKKQDAPKPPKEKKSHGGKRANSGRKPEEERKAEHRQGFQDFAAQEVKVKMPDEKGVMVEKKMTRAEIARHKLFGGVLRGDLRAIEEFNDRTMARAMQPVGGSDSEPIVLKLDF